MSHRFFRPLIAFFSLTLALGPALLGQPAYTPYHFKIVATTLKGTYADGPATVARFNAPVAVAMDLRGNLIIADRDNHAIRQISPEGNVTTLAGLAGHAGSADGAGANARFNKPVSVAVDPSGNILVADSGNYTVRRITPQGIVSTLAGLAGTAGHVDGSAGVARFTGPQTVATDPAGNVWVADFQPIPSYTPGTPIPYSTIRKITPDGVVSTPVGTYSSLTIANPNAPLPATPGGFLMTYLSGLGLDAAGNLYFSDTYRIFKITPAGAISMLLSSGPAATQRGPLYIVGVTADGAVYAGTQGPVLQKIAPDGTVTKVNTSSSFYPAALVQDANGNLFGPDSVSSVRKIAPDGTVTVVAGQSPTPSPWAQFFTGVVLETLDHGLGRDDQGNLYFAGANYIGKVASDGPVTVLAGAVRQPGSVDGTGSDARFQGISGLTAAPSGEIYAIDGNAIRKITATGMVTTLAGDISDSGSIDGAGNVARFKFPKNLDLDAGGNIYVADQGNNIIRKITPAGVVTTLAGLANTSGSADGAGSSARFKTLGSLVCDRTTGNLFVLDGVTLRRITPDGTVATLNPDMTFLASSRLAVDPSGNILVSTWQYLRDASQTLVPGSQIWQINPLTMAVAVIGGSFNDAGFAEGTGPGALLGTGIDGMAVATDGRIFALSGDSTLFVGTPNAAPVIRTADPIPSTPGNQTTTFALPASDPDGDPLTYTITGTTGGTATLANNLATFHPTPGATTGLVSFTASDGYLSSSGTVGITFTAAITGLANISTRGRIGSGDDVLIAGFVLTGATAVPKPVLIRAVGPTLSTQGVAHPLGRPVIRLQQGDTVLGTNIGWGTASNATAVAATTTATGAFALPAGSNDSALLIMLPPGAYTAVISGVDGEGVSLAEVYDGEVANPASHPVNLSSRGVVGTGENVLIAGFVVFGDAPKKFLIRAVGPGLAAYGVTGRIADPQVRVQQGSTVVTQASGWTNDAEMQAAITQTGAFPLPAGSADAAAVVTLAPGSYTAAVSSQSGGTGIALVEVYQLP